MCNECDKCNKKTREETHQQNLAFLEAVGEDWLLNKGRGGAYVDNVL